MGAELISILGLGFMLGLKHALEPDHVIAVSTIASRSRKRCDRRAFSNVVPMKWERGLMYGN